MKNIKILGILCLSIIMLSVFNVVSATVNEDIAIVKDQNGEYTIYTNGKGNDFIYYAFSDNENKTNLEYQVPKKDVDNINVAFINIEAYNKYFADDNKSYLFIGNDQNNLSKIEVDLSEYISQEDIDTLKNITNIINIETDKKTDVTETDDKIITTTIGTVKILDESLNDIKYALLNEDIDNILSEINDIKNLNTDDKYKMVKKFTKFKSTYNNLLNNTEFIPLEGKTILQPESVKNADKYVLLISANNSNRSKLNDIKILNATSSSNTENKEIVTQKEVEKVVKAPITNENITLIIIASILFIALIVLVTFRFKKDKKSLNNE